MNYLIISASICAVIGIIKCEAEYEYDLAAELDEGNSSGERTDSGIVARMKDLGWKIICEEDEWKAQFEEIRSTLTVCLRLKKIAYDDEDDSNAIRKIDFSLNLGKPEENPYCTLSKYWKKCVHLMEGIDCMEPNGGILLDKKRKSQYRQLGKGRISWELMDPYDWMSMHKPYRVLCEISQVYSKANPLDLLGGF